MNSRIILAGADGYIGQRIQRNTQLKEGMLLLSPQQNDSYIPFDLLRVSEFDFSSINPHDTVIMLAGISSPDVCASKYQMAFNINVSGTIQFIGGCLARSARVLFFSSDTVYGISEGENDEDIFPSDPAGEYGNMKLLVERYFKGEPDFKSFRLSYVFSWYDKFTSYLRTCHEQKTKPEIFHPFIRKAVYIDDLVSCILNIHNDWEKYSNQFFNICGPDYLSRVEIVQLFNKHIGNLEFQVITPDNGFFKARPQKIFINSKYSASLLGKRFTQIEDAFAFEKQKFLK